MKTEKNRDASERPLDLLVMRDLPQQATPNGELRRQIMSSTVPKNEREHWAAKRIEEVENALNDLLNDCINFDGAKLTDCIMKEASNVLKKYDA